MGTVVNMRGGGARGRRPAPADGSKRGRTYVIPEMVSEWPATDRLKAGEGPSVTNILNVLNKPALMPWSAKLERAHAVETVLRTLSNPDDELADALSSEGVRWTEAAQAVAGRVEKALGKYAYMRASDEATGFGKHVHAIIEARINGILDPTSTAAELEAADAWSEWSAGAGFTMLWSEKKVWHPEHRYAGRADTFAEIGGLRVVVDWKTSKAVYPESFMQVSAYARAIEACMGEKDVAGLVVRIPKLEGDRVEARIVTLGDVEEHFEAFLALRKAWDWSDKWAR